MAIGSRLRILSEIVSKDAASIYELYGINIKPKWFSVFFSLADGDTKGVTVIAKEIGQTHASVSTIAKEMVKAGVVAEVKNDTDRRQTIITLTKHGRELANELVVQCRDVERAVEQISDEATHDLWEALAEWEKILAEKSIFQRVAEIKSLREQSEVLIVGYENKYQEAYFSDVYEEYRDHSLVLYRGGKPIGIGPLCIFKKLGGCHLLGLRGLL